MNPVKCLPHAIALSALLLVSGAGRDAVLRAQESSAPAAAAAVVKTHTYVSLDPVPRGSEFQIAVAVEIASGFHMNSHKPLDSYLIPTTLTPQPPAGIKLAETVYPNGHNQKFPFSPDKPLNVYSGSVTLRARLSAQPSARIGSTAIPITLRYQACNNSACLPPVKIPLTVQIQVSGAGTKGRALHPEIFSAASAPRK